MVQLKLLDKLFKSQIENATSKTLEKDLKKVKAHYMQKINERMVRFRNNVANVVDVPVVDTCAYRNPLCPKSSWEVCKVGHFWDKNQCK